MELPKPFAVWVTVLRVTANFGVAFRACYELLRNSLILFGNHTIRSFEKLLVSACYRR